MPEVSHFISTPTGHVCHNAKREAGLLSVMPYEISQKNKCNCGEVDWHKQANKVSQRPWEAWQVHILGQDRETACAKVHSPHRESLLPLSLEKDILFLGVQWQSEDKSESSGSCVCRSQVAFQHTHLQNEVTDAFFPLSKFHVNSSFIPLTQKLPAKRILENFIQINPVDAIQTTTVVYVHVVHSMLCKGIMGNAKYTVYTAHIYEDIVSKERWNGPFNSTRWHSTKCQKKCYRQKLKMPRKGP